MSPLRPQQAQKTAMQKFHGFLVIIYGCTKPKFYPSTATNINSTAVLLTDHYNVDLSIESQYRKEKPHEKVIQRVQLDMVITPLEERRSINVISISLPRINKSFYLCSMFV